jgi:HK97 family phage major capsid protein
MPEPKPKRNLTTEQQEVVDEINQAVSEMRKAHDSELAALRANVSEAQAAVEAVKATLSHSQVQADLDRFLAIEEHLAKLPVEGEANIGERLVDLETALQRLEDAPAGTASAGAFDPRAQAREVFKDEVASSPVWSELIDHDPALTAEYYNDFAKYIAAGNKAALGVPGDLRTQAARAYNYVEDVVNNPRNLRSHGIDRLMNTLSSDFDPGLGMVVPPTVAQRVVRKAYELSPLVADSGRATTASKVWPFLRDTGWEPTVRTRGEREDVVEDDENDELYEEDEIAVHELSVTTRLTLVMIEDGIDVISEYERRTALATGKRFAVLAHRGKGGKKEPLGLTNDTHVPRLKSGAADTIPWRALLNLGLDLEPFYEPGAMYYLSKGALKSAVFATDGIGQYIWEPTQTNGAPSLIHGYPWKRDAWLSNETGVSEMGVSFATGATPVLFGNVGEACVAVERLGARALIDDVTKKGWRKYWTRRRWGWGVVQPAGLRLLEVGVDA